MARHFPLLEIRDESKWRPLMFYDPNHPGKHMLSPYNAWRVLVRCTGVQCGRSTFYRWVDTGKVFSVRLGQRIFIPWSEVQNIIRQCRAGERL